MYTKRFVESIRMLQTKGKELTYEELSSKLYKWMERGNPLKVDNFGIFYNGYTTFFPTMDELIDNIYNLVKKGKVNYFTIAILDKTFKEEGD